MLAAVFASAPLWVAGIVTPEMPSLPRELLAGRRLWIAAACYGVATIGAAGLWWRQGAAKADGGDRSRGLVAMQAALVVFVPAVLLPFWQLGDRLRSLPVRDIAAAVQRQQRPSEPLAMVGMLKPSLLYYSHRAVIYEGAPAAGLVNLAERLAMERRVGQSPSSAASRPTLLLVINAETAHQPYWRGLQPERLGRAGIYNLWRLDRRRLEQRAAELRSAGIRPDWQEPRPERY